MLSFGMTPSTRIHHLYQKLHQVKNPELLTHTLNQNPLKKPAAGKRPLSICVEDAFFGDSGKGSVTVKFLHMFSRNKMVMSLRYNGGANAGHETIINGKKIVTHQAPSGLLQENALGIITRGVVLHPQDLLFEIARIEKACGGLPGTLVIDERTPLALDTHRARESVLNTFTTGGRGSTGKGIASAYESLYGRYVVTVKDLLSRDWKDILSRHYDLYARFIAGFDMHLADVAVPRLSSKEKRVAGSKKQFLDELAHVRSDIKTYVSATVYQTLQKAWDDPKIPFVIEGAQGAGIDPYHGVYPDVTASRPMSRNINDATYNIIVPEELAVRVGVMKTTYMSSVGTRKLPARENGQHAGWIQTAFDEKGRTTGRLRDIYDVSIPIAQYLHRAAGYTHLVATHLDASRLQEPIHVVTHYTDKVSGREQSYLPYQDILDRFVPHYLTFDGWDGEAIRSVRTPKAVPYAARTLLHFLGQTIAPVIMATTGAAFDEYISWLPAR